MKVLYTVTFVISCISYGWSQQQGIFAQMGSNALSYNPAFTGLENCRMLSFGQRIQWVGFSDAPDQQYLNYNTRLFENYIDSVVPYNMPISNNKLYNQLAKPVEVRRRRHSGIGAHFIRDSYGPFTKMSGLLSYAYHHRLNKEFQMSVGASAGISHMAINPNKIWVLDDGDKTYDDYAQRNASGLYLDGTFGALLYNRDMYLGYGVNQLFMNRPFQNLPNGGEHQLRMHHMLSAGYVIRPIKSLEVVPMLNLLKTRAAPMSLNIGAKARLHKMVWAAANWRMAEAVNLRLGIMAFQKIAFNYGYEVATSSVSAYNFGTHEVSINLFFNAPKAPKHLW